MKDDLWLEERHCPICGKEFYPTVLWAYKHRRKLYCSWKCLQKRFDNGRHPMCKGYHVKPILQYTLAGKLIKQWSCAREAEEALGFSKQKIAEACRLKKQHKGYYWRYKENELSEMQK